MRQLLYQLEPRYKVPSKQGVNDMLEQKFADMKVKLNRELSSLPEPPAITHDGLTSNSTQSYDTVTCHMITSDWELRHAVLGTVKVQGQHTGENIAESIKTTVDEWGIGTPAAVTTDNAANEQKAIRLLGFQQFGCFGHRINLVVKKAIETPQVKDLLQRGRTLVSFFHKSSSATDLLVEKQKLLYPERTTQLRLIMDCVTRWNSTLNMLERLLELMPCIVNMASDQSLSKSAAQTIKSNSYSFEEESTLKTVVQILKPFETATTVLCSETSPSMQHVLPVTKKLLVCVQDKDDDYELVRGMKNTMRKEIETRVPTEELPLLATLLSPDTKHALFLSEEERKFGKKILMEKAELLSVKVKRESNSSASHSSSQLPELPQMPDQQPTPDVIIEEEISEPKPKLQKIQCSDSTEWLDDIVVCRESTVSPEILVQCEIDRYFELQRQQSDGHLTLLQWW